MALIVKKTFLELEMPPDAAAKQRSKSSPAALFHASEGHPGLRKGPKSTTVAAPMLAPCPGAKEVDAVVAEPKKIDILKELAMSSCIEGMPVGPEQQQQAPTTDRSLLIDSAHGTSREDLLALKLKLGHALCYTNKFPPVQTSPMQPLPEAQGDNDCEDRQRLRVLQKRLALALAGFQPSPPPPPECFALVRRLCAPEQGGQHEGPFITSMDGGRRAGGTVARPAKWHRRGNTPRNTVFL